MYNRVIMVGNLTRDVELRYIPSGAAIAKGAIATTHKYKSQDGIQKEEVCFLDFNVFGRSAEIVNQYVRKGSKVLLEGRLVLEQWVANDGTNRNRHTLRVDNFKFLDSRSDNNNGGNYNNSNNGQYQNSRGGGNYSNHNSGNYNNSNSGEYNNKDNSKKIPEVDIDDDEIPF